MRDDDGRRVQLGRGRAPHEGITLRERVAAALLHLHPKRDAVPPRVRYLGERLGRGGTRLARRGSKRRIERRPAIAVAVLDPDVIRRFTDQRVLRRGRRPASAMPDRSSAATRSACAVRQRASIR